MMTVKTVRMWSSEDTLTLLMRVSNGTINSKNCLGVSYNTKHTLSRQPAIPLQTICPKKEKHVHKNACTKMFLAAQSQQPRTGNNPGCPLRGE